MALDRPASTLFILIPGMDLRIQKQKSEARKSTGLAILEYRLAVDNTKKVYRKLYRRMIFLDI